jgi:hypothetical protein
MNPRQGAVGDRLVMYQTGQGSVIEVGRFVSPAGRCLDVAAFKGGELSKRTLLTFGLAGIVVAAGIIAFGFFLDGQGLDRADKWASVVGAFVAMSSLVVSGMALLQRLTGSSDGATHHHDSGPVTVYNAKQVNIGRGQRVRAKFKYTDRGRRSCWRNK